jgi:peroxiredoxin/cytidylate kinase
MVYKVKVGTKAPNFNLPDVENRIRSLKEFLGQKVILVIYVGAFASKCTKEICEFRDSVSRLINLRAQIVGIDVNVPFMNKVLAEKHRLHFPILSDYNREVIKTYGLEGLDSDKAKGKYKRAILVLDENGIVRYMWVSDNPDIEPKFDEIKGIIDDAVYEEQTAMVPRSVITISRQIGSGGDIIAKKISEILGYAYFDKNLLVSEAKSLGVSEEDIADFSEDHYKVKSIVDKILLRKKTVAASLASKDNALVSKTLDEEACLSVIQTVINSLASRGKMVIVGRGGQAILKHKIDVLHVRIVAPVAARVKRVMKDRGLSKEVALKLIEATDKAEIEYLQRFYGIDLSDPAVYDVVLNTRKMNLDIATRVIISVASQTKVNLKKQVIKK